MEPFNELIKNLFPKAIYKDITMQDNLKILLVTDFRDAAKTAIQTLITLKTKTTIDLTLLHVVTSFWKNWASSGLYEKEAWQRLATWQKQITGSNDPQALLIEQGHVAATAVEIANKHHIDLIMLGGGNKEFKGCLLTGSSSAGIVRMASQSVWLCKKAEFTNILCGIDCSDMSAKALNAAIDLCRRFGAKLNVVAAIPLLNFNPLGMEDTEIKKIEYEYKNERSNEIEKFLKQFDFSGIDVEHHYPWGSPSHVMLNMAEDFNLDLIVIGATGHSQLNLALMGSTAEKILNLAPCSLLIVR